MYETSNSKWVKAVVSGLPLSAFIRRVHPGSVAQRDECATRAEIVKREVSRGDSGRHLSANGQIYTPFDFYFTFSPLDAAGGIECAKFSPKKVLFVLFTIVI